MPNRNIKTMFLTNSVLFTPKMASVTGLFSGISINRIAKADIKNTKLVIKEIIEIRCLEKNPRLLKPSPTLIIFPTYKRISLTQEFNLDYSKNILENEKNNQNCYILNIRNDKVIILIQLYICREFFYTYIKAT